MKTEENSFDLKVQAAVLGLGRLLSARQDSAPYHSSKPPSSPSPDALAAEVERVLSLVMASTARRLLGLRSGFKVSENTLRLKTVAIIGWRMIGEANTINTVDDVVREVLQGDNGPYCERLLITRDALARMVCDGFLTITAERGEFSQGGLLLPAKSYSWLCGGKDSKGDFSPSKIIVGRLNRALGQDGQDGKTEAVPLRVPTAKEIFNKVRQDVVGLDPQVRVLASRIALHVARAELLKSGVQDHAVGNAVILLAGASGAGKTFLVERTATAASLPFCQIDSTTLTASGYAGSDIDEIYKLLVHAAGGDAIAASRGLCFLDEFDKKSARFSSRGGQDCRDVGGEAVQMELLAKLQATTTPFVVGGKRGNDGCRSFLFDGRPTGYVLAGVFSGLDAEIERQAGRRGIGFASEAGNRQHVRIADCLKSLGFLDELVNRVCLVIRLPTPCVRDVMQVTANGLLNGFNLVLASKNINLLPSDAAVRAIGDYSMQTGAFYRGAKAIYSNIAAEALFDPRKGTVFIEKADVIRAVERLSSGFIQPESKVSVGVVEMVTNCELGADDDIVAACR